MQGDGRKSEHGKFGLDTRGNTFSPLGYSDLEQAAQRVCLHILKIVENFTGQDPIQLACFEWEKDWGLQRFLPTYIILCVHKTMLSILGFQTRDQAGAELPGALERKC